MLGGWVSVGWGATFCGHGYRVWVWLSGGVVCGGEWLGLGWVFGVLGVVCGVGLVGGVFFCLGCGFHWGAWGGVLFVCDVRLGFGWGVVEAYLGAACFGGGEVGALVDAVDSFAGEGLGGCGKRVLGEVGHSGVVWGLGGVVCVRGG